MHEADLDQVLASARRIAEIRELKTAAPETALPELGRMLTPATPDAVLNEVLMVIRSFGSKASELFPAVKKLAEGHADRGVRDLAKEILESCGLRVSTASDGLDALEVYRKHSGEIDVVLLDLTMPRMGGRECLQELRRINADVKVLLSSGYNEQESLGVVSDEKTGFIHKPYQQHNFLASFRAILEC